MKDYNGEYDCERDQLQELCTIFNSQFVIKNETRFKYSDKSNSFQNGCIIEEGAKEYLKIAEHFSNHILLGFFPKTVGYRNYKNLDQDFYKIIYREAGVHLGFCKRQQSKLQNGCRCLTSYKCYKRQKKPKRNPCYFLILSSLQNLAPPNINP